MVKTKTMEVIKTTLQEMISKALQEYNLPDEAIALLNKDYMALAVKGVDDKEGYKLCHDARMDIKSRRVEVEKTRKKLKEDALVYGKAVDTEAKRITAMLEPIESHLEAQEKIVDDEKARIKAEDERKAAEKVQARVDKLYDLGCICRGGYFSLPFAPDVIVPEAIIKTCPDENFDNFFFDFKTLADKEKQRIAEEKLKQEEEKKKLVEERAAQEAGRIRLEAVAVEQREKEQELKKKQEAIDAENKRIADEKQKAEEDRLLQERIDRERAEAAENAKKEEAERIEREAREKKETERLEKEELARIEAMRPDKERVVDYLNSICKHMSDNCPALKDRGAVYVALVDAEAIIEKTLDETIKKLETLVRKKQGR